MALNLRDPARPLAVGGLTSVEAVQGRLKEALTKLDALEVAAKFGRVPRFSATYHAEHADQSETLNERLTQAMHARFGEIVAEVRQGLLDDQQRLKREALALAMDFAAPAVAS